jgi:hypothetical protein
MLRKIKKMKTKVIALLAVFLIAVSMVATISFATEVAVPPVVAVDDVTLIHDFMEQYFATFGTEPPIKKISMTVCVWIWMECPLVEQTCGDCQDGIKGPVVLKFRATLEMKCDLPVITVEPIDACDDTCGEPIDVVVNTVTPDEALIVGAIDELMLRLLEQKTLANTDQGLDACIIRMRAEICVRIEFATCKIPPYIAKILVDLTVVNGVPIVQTAVLNWHELIMNQLTVNGIIGFCRGNMIQLRYDGPGIYENGLRDAHFYLVYKVNHDPLIRDLQAHIELMRVGPDTYVMEIYHSINNGEFSFELPYQHDITLETPYFTAATIVDDLC